MAAHNAPKIDRKGVAYRSIRDIFRSPVERFVRALEKEDTEWMRALLANKSVDANHLLSEKVKPERKDWGTGRDNSGESLLHRAVRHENAGAVLLLLEHGADPNVNMYFGETPLHYAGMLGNEVILALLAAHGGDLKLRKYNRSTYWDDTVMPCPLDEFRSETKREFDPKAHEEWLALWRRDEINGKIEDERNVKSTSPSKTRKM